MKEISGIPGILPIFEAWKNYETDQLEMMLKSWRLILTWESLGGESRLKWHEFGRTCIFEIEAEMQNRD
jgi:hypothetical protein